MPFAKEFDDVYELGIEAACKAAGAYCERLDKQIYTELMLERIYNQIAKADMIIADMTGKNVNVFYEVGYAHALGKRTILVTKDADHIPFDMKHFPHIVYEAGIAKLREDLGKRVKHFIALQDESVSDRFPLEVEIQNLQRLRMTATGPKPGVGVQIKLTFGVKNVSPRMMETGSFAVGIRTNEDMFGCQVETETDPFRESVRKVKVSGEGFMHMLPDLPRLFPQQTEQHYVEVLGIIPANDSTVDMSIRVFTDQGTRDFEVRSPSQ
jgi:nucleoside 2-deoxyribosyltransferase